ncbi:MAG: hypothetical protein QOG15_125 [Solirubrobacteraceae bacterium]|nr:hypothetical protein [Solirubrobacteraceae bacterium]
MPVLRISLLTALLCLLFAGSASASATQAMTFEAPRDLENPAKRPAAMQEIASLGVHSLRVIVQWSRVAPNADSPTRPKFDATNPAAYNWSQYDPILADAAARGWPVLVTISSPVPKWATKYKLDSLTRPDPAEFGQFVTAVGRHYGAQVNLWSIWNEPNQPQFLRPQFANGGKPQSPLMYRKLFQAATAGLAAAGQANDTVLLGETSPRGSSRVVAPLTFLRGVLCLNAHYKRRGSCGALNAGGYAHHAYTTRQGPSFIPPRKDEVTIGVLSRLTKALDRATKAKALTKRLPIYLTEFGTQSLPDDQQGVSLANQVKFRAIAERIAYDSPRVVAFSQYLLTDSDPTGPKQYGGFESGLRFADGKPKPSLGAFPLPLAVQRVGAKGVSIWGLVRPATGVTTATVTYKDKGSSTYKKLRDVTTNSRGYLQFSASYRSGRRWNLTWQGRTSYPVTAYKK